MNDKKEEKKSLEKKLELLLNDAVNGKNNTKCGLINENLNKILDKINNSFDFDLFQEEKLDCLETVKTTILKFLFIEFI